MIGEIGGTKEQEAAEFISSEFTKPIAALIVGESAPPGKRMGHAGAIITGSAARAVEKKRALAAAGVAIIPAPGRDAARAVEKKRALAAAGVAIIPAPGEIGRTLQELIGQA